MNHKIIPRKHRKQVVELIESFKSDVGNVDHYFKNWNEFLTFRLNGTNDGWLETNDKEYQALLWLIEVTDMTKALLNYQALESESE